MVDKASLVDLVNLKVEGNDNFENINTLTPDTDLHYLENKWAFYFFKYDRSKDWIDNMKKVIDFDTVEGFWGLVNYIAPPSKLPNGCDYYIFKDVIQPMWEDERNKNGGMCILPFDKRENISYLDSCWLEILMLLVGETFEDDSEEICGAVFNKRGKGDRISVWTTNCSSTEPIKRIGNKIKDALGLRCSVEYVAHADAKKMSTSRAK